MDCQQPRRTRGDALSRGRTQYQAMAVSLAREQDRSEQPKFNRMQQHSPQAENTRDLLLVSIEYLRGNVLFPPQRGETKPRRPARPPASRLNPPPPVAP